MPASVGETYRIKDSNFIWLAVSPWKFVTLFEGKVIERSIWTQIPGQLAEQRMESRVLCQYWQCTSKELDEISHKYIKKPLPAVYSATILFKRYKAWLDFSKKLED